MTIDAHGRSHKPAGSPASTGGQFAKGTAPGQAQLLGLSAVEERTAASDAAVESIRRVAAVQHFDQFATEARELWPTAATLAWTEQPGDTFSPVLLDAEGSFITSGFDLRDRAPSISRLRARDLFERSTPNEHGVRVVDLTTEHAADTDVAPLTAILDDDQLDQLEDAITARRLELRHARSGPDAARLLSDLTDPAQWDA